ncbi:MAG: glycosyltransferase [Patescibacteria group bacterium]|nr:glycosyltransferase [Patescibacteria group bacterium]MDE2116761.1 glycosyltransferase [Patescibacteria group bacterium]
MSKLIMISTRNPKLFDEGSDVRARMAEYGTVFDEIHIVTFSLHRSTPAGRSALSGNVFVYPTGSRSKLSYVRDAARIGRSIIRERGFAPADSVITAQDPFETGLAACKISKETGLPLHIQIHTDLYSPFFKKGLLARARLVLAKRALGNARAVRAVSEKIRASLPDGVRAKTSVLPIYADIEMFAGASPIDLRAKYPQFGKVVLMASRLSVEKNIPLALDAFSLIAPHHPDGGLVIIGEGPERPALERRAFAAGVAEKVIFEPWMERPMLARFMKSADAFLSTSLFEGYGLSMLEAHAAGAPLVATDAGIARELTSSVCEPTDVSCIADRLDATLSGSIENKPYAYPYHSKGEHLESFRRDIERALR